MRLYLIFTLFVFSMCSSNTEVNTTTFSGHYDNGKSIEVIREDHSTRYKGIFSGRDYGGSHNFNYRFTIEPDESEWSGSTDQAPLNLVFCADETYLKVTERMLKFDSLYAKGQPKDTTFYFKNLDERYFFKLFGDQKFVPTDSIEYYEKKSKGIEVPVPYLN